MENRVKIPVNMERREMTDRASTKLKNTRKYLIKKLSDE